jgi:hypothetical protein
MHSQADFTQYENLENSREKMYGDTLKEKINHCGNFSYIHGRNTSANLRNSEYLILK